MLHCKIKIELTDIAKELFELNGIEVKLFQTRPTDAGFDVRYADSSKFCLKAHTRALVPTGLKIELENPNWEIQVRPRSGLAAKNGITVVNTPGTVDYEYRDEIKVILLNTSNDDFYINPGDRIAQICVRPIPTVEIEYVDKINTTTRGGFGSSGKC